MKLAEQLQEMLERTDADAHRLLDVALGKSEVRPFIIGVLHSAADEPIPPSIASIANDLVADARPVFDRAVDRIRTELRSEGSAA